MFLLHVHPFPFSLQHSETFANFPSSSLFVFCLLSLFSLHIAYFDNLVFSFSGIRCTELEYLRKKQSLRSVVSSSLLTSSCFTFDFRLLDNCTRIECMLSSCFPRYSVARFFSCSASSMTSPPKTSSSKPSTVDLLILGAGWTSTFLIPHLESSHPCVSFASTTRDGRNGSIKWSFDPSNSGDSEQYDVLPRAKTVLITFPIRGEGGSKGLVKGYAKSKGINQSESIRWIQLGSTGIWDVSPLISKEKAER